MKTFSLLCVLVAAAAACSKAPPAASSVTGPDLLARAPDTIVWQAGSLEPDEDERWGSLGQFGWETSLAEEDGRDLVWTNREKAYLTLPASSNAERTLKVRLIGPTSAEKEVELRLNSVKIAALRVSDEWKEETLRAESHFWLEGENQLEISTPLTVLEDGRKVGVGVARIDYDERREVEHDEDARRLTLAPGTSARYRIQPLAPGRVVLSARASGAGELAVALAPVDTATGTVAVGEPQKVALPADQALERAYPLPAHGALIELSVAWSSGATGELTLERLALEESTPAARPPVILISVDTLSARHMSVYGYGLDTTPNLARFASEAHVFENCITNAPWTLPSFMALMSGQYAVSHRLDTTGGSELWERWYLSHNRWTMAEFLRAAGYRTAGFVDNAWITESFGFPQGFEVYDASAADNNTEKHVDPNGGIRQTTGAAREYLAGLAPGEPFFLFVHCFDVHGPYTPPKPYDGRFDAAPDYDHDRTAPAGGPDNSFGIIPTYIARGEVGDGEVPAHMKTAPIEGAYDEGVQFVDEELGKFFEHLRTTGIYERAWIIVTADHGETMADTPYYFGHGVLDQDVLRIPLLVRPPGGKPGGARVRETVQLVDLYPTVAELVGSRAPREDLHGQSLLPLLRGESRADAFALSETGPMRQAALVRGRWKIVEIEPSKDAQRQAILSYPFLTSERVAELEQRVRERIAKQKDAVDGRTPEEREKRLFAWKADEALARAFLVTRHETGLTESLFREMQASPAFDSLLQFLKRALDSAHYELFDLEADPLGRVDVAAQHPAELAEMKQALEREKARRETAKQNARPPTKRVELSAESIQALQDLGYSGKAD